MIAATQQQKETIAFSLTPSSIREYLRCPYLFKSKTLSRGTSIRSSSSPAFSFGISMHAALEEIYKPSSTLNQSTDVEHILRKHWSNDGYFDRKEAETYFIRGLEALRQYMKVINPADSITIGTEVFISRIVRLDGIRVRLGCKIDRIEKRPDDMLELLDYKTCASGKVPTKESLTTDLPTFIYYLLARIMYPRHPHIVVSQLNLLTLAKVEVTYEDADLAANKRALIKLVHEIELAEFSPRPNSTCSWCPVRDTCPAFNTEADLDGII